jgi:hypothetical protein
MYCFLCRRIMPSFRCAQLETTLRNASSIPKICGVGSLACSSNVCPFFSSFFSVYAHKQAWTKPAPTCISCATWVSSGFHACFARWSRNRSVVR